MQQTQETREIVNVLKNIMVEHEPIAKAAIEQMLSNEPVIDKDFFPSIFARDITSYLILGSGILVPETGDPLRIPFARYGDLRYKMSVTPAKMFADDRTNKHYLDSFAGANNRMVGDGHYDGVIQFIPFIQNSNKMMDYLSSKTNIGFVDLRFSDKSLVYWKKQYDFVKEARK